MIATHSAQAPVSLDAVRFAGCGLNRPECVIATAAGDIYTADWRGGVARSRIDRDAKDVFLGRLPDARPLRPNGIALRRDGSFLLADLGEVRGGVFVLQRNGQVDPLLEDVDGIDLPPTNFVHEDTAQRIWITVSTRLVPRARAYRADVADGFIVLIDQRGARIVVDGLGYTNEALPSPDGKWLYVNETFGRRLSRLPLRADGSLGARQTVTTFGAGDFPDGLAFDSEGAVWITSIISNRVIRVMPDGAQQTILEDCNAAHLETCEAAFAANTLGRFHLDTTGGRRLKNISSLAFAGTDRRTALLGCLLGDSLAYFRTEVAGAAPVHWNWQ